MNDKDKKAIEKLVIAAYMEGVFNGRLVWSETESKTNLEKLLNDLRS